MALHISMLARILNKIHSIDIDQHDLWYLPSQLDLIDEHMHETKNDAYGVRALMRVTQPTVISNTFSLLL